MIFEIIINYVINIDKNEVVPTADLLGSLVDCACGDQLVEIDVQGEYLIVF